MTSSSPVPGDVLPWGPPPGDVVCAARDGDPQAFAELWRRHSPAVLGFARSRGAREPEDLTSEVFLSAFRGLGTFEGGEDAFKGFLFTVAHRRLVDEIRTVTRRPEVVDWSADEDLRSSRSAEECALEVDGRAEVVRALESLSADQRDVLVLRILGDLTIDQVATALGKRTGAVKALQRRGLEALRRRITEQREEG